MPDDRYVDDLGASVSPPGLEIAKGNIQFHKAVNKFGHAPSGIQTTITDIWSRADDTPTQSIWLAPTAARIHTLASTSALDKSAGTGANTVVVYYLPSWTSNEASETVTLNGTSGVAMTNAAVMIHRMHVGSPPAGATSPNVGTISATAATDSTITAIIRPAEGQTKMAIYGVPSTKVLYVLGWYAGIDKSSAVAVTADFFLRYCPNPATQSKAYLQRHHLSVQSTGTNYVNHQFFVPYRFAGPGILKISATGSANDIDGKAGFDAILVDAVS